ncbi:hypothetical protein ACO0QE_001567 [Hanseniaspora vineae]
MAILSKIIITVALMQLLHSGYSIYEFNEINKRMGSAVIGTNANLPLDIKYEVYSALVLFILGVFCSFDKITYTPFSSTHTKNTGEYLQPIAMNKATTIDNLQELDPYGMVNNTPYIVDIIAKRKAYSEWEKSKNSKKK